jgi:hypothetical protein
VQLRPAFAEQLLEVHVADVARVVVPWDDEHLLALDPVELLAHLGVLLREAVVRQVAGYDHEIRPRLVHLADRGAQEVAAVPGGADVQVGELRDQHGITFSATADEPTAPRARHARTRRHLRQASGVAAPLQLLASPASPQVERRADERRARLLAWGANVWHLFEFAVAVGAGLAAGSIALVGFGFDSLIEALSALVIVWLFSRGRGSSEAAERLAQRLVAVGYFVLAAYVAVESSRDLIGGHHPETSWIGVALAAVTAPTMPILAAAKRRVGRRLGSRATVSEAAQNLLCAYLSIALLAGLLLNALVGWWWADPAAALVIGAVAVREGIAGWRGDGCECCE